MNNKIKNWEPWRRVWTNGCKGTGVFVSQVVISQAVRYQISCPNRVQSPVREVTLHMVPCALSDSESCYVFVIFVSFHTDHICRYYPTLYHGLDQWPRPLVPYHCRDGGEAIIYLPRQKWEAYHRMMIHKLQSNRDKIPWKYNTVTEHSPHRYQSRDCQVLYNRYRVRPYWSQGVKRVKNLNSHSNPMIKSGTPDARSAQPWSHRTR